MENINYRTEQIGVTGEGIDGEVTINYNGMIETGTSWLDTLANANLKVKVQAKMREILRSELSQADKDKRLAELENIMPENVIGSSVSFGRSDIDNILAGEFGKTLPSTDTLVEAFANETIKSRKEFLEVRKLVNAERKRRKKADKKKG